MSVPNDTSRLAHIEVLNRGDSISQAKSPPCKTLGHLEGRMQSLVLLLDDKWLFFVHCRPLVVFLELYQGPDGRRRPVDLVLSRGLLAGIHSVFNNHIVPPLLKLSYGLVPLLDSLFMLVESPLDSDCLLVICGLDAHVLSTLHELQCLNAGVMLAHTCAIVRAKFYLRALSVFDWVIMDIHLALVCVLYILVALSRLSFYVLNLILIVECYGLCWVVLVSCQVERLLLKWCFDSRHVYNVLNSHLVNLEWCKRWLLSIFAVPFLSFFDIILLFLHELEQLYIYIFLSFEEPLLFFKEMFRAHHWPFDSWAISWAFSHSHSLFNFWIDLVVLRYRVAPEHVESGCINILTWYILSRIDCYWWLLLLSKPIYSFSLSFKLNSSLREEVLTTEASRVLCWVTCWLLLLLFCLDILLCLRKHSL